MNTCVVQSTYGKETTEKKKQEKKKEIKDLNYEKIFYFRLYSLAYFCCLCIVRMIAFKFAK